MQKVQFDPASSWKPPPSSPRDREHVVRFCFSLCPHNARKRKEMKSVDNAERRIHSRGCLLDMREWKRMASISFLQKRALQQEIGSADWDL